MDKRPKWKTVGGALAVWTCLGFFFGAQNYLILQYASSPYTWSQAIGLALAEWYFWGALFPGLSAVARRFPFEHGRWFKAILVHLPLMVVIALVRVMLESVVLAITGFAPARNPSLLLNGSLLTCALVLGAAHAWSYSRISAERSRRELQLQARLAEAQLGLLRAQLQPHFLFNTLHSISTLMHRDVAAAETMLTRLSDLLRMALDKGDLHEVPLQSEIEFTRTYLEIQSVRFGERLNVSWAIDSNTLELLVPTMVLQPLVENAIRHGISVHREGGRVGIGARLDGKMLELHVEDDGPGNDPGHDSENDGIGLRNIRERLAKLYGEQQELSVQRPPNGGFRVAVRLPARGGESA